MQLGLKAGLRGWFGAATGVVFGGLLTACGQGPQGGPPPGFGGPSPVEVVTVGPRDLPVVFEYTGQARGSREVEVRARVGGILLRRNYTEGGLVKAGQSLFQIDPVPFQTALAKADADRVAVQARLQQAQRNAARLKPLFEVKAVSQKEYDDATSAEQIASADLKAAEARVREARLNLDYTRVLAPVGGQAGAANQSEGSLVSGPEVLLTTLVQTHPIKVMFGVPDGEQARTQADIRSGALKLPQDGFDVQLFAADGTPLNKGGRLRFSEPRINSATGTVESQAELPNADGALRPGQFVRVRLGGGVRPGVIQLPQRAVLEGPQGKFVYVVQASDKPEMKGAEVATPRPVTVGEWTDTAQGRAWVIRDGLKAGERVIVDGLMRIGPGAPVQVAAPAAAASGAKTAASASAASAPQGAPAPAASAASK